MSFPISLFDHFFFLKKITAELIIDVAISISAEDDISALQPNAITFSSLKLFALGKIIII